MQDLIPIRNALLSVFDKTGLGPLAKALHQKGVTLYCTGGTYRHLTQECHLPAVKIEAVTEFPEMMDGRVKTLHPKIFGGVLARRGEPQDMQAVGVHGIPLFDLVVVNLYEFSSVLGKAREEQACLVDIGGPALLRAAAKNCEAVTTLSDPSDYDAFLEELERTQGKTGSGYRLQRAVAAFERTSLYDAQIAQQWRDPSSLPGCASLLPQMPLRYGENPHQRAAWAGQPGMWQVLQGKELSYNNLLDTEAAVRLVDEFAEPAIAVIKHNNPCGVAIGSRSQAELFSRAFGADSRSAFGGIVACNRTVDVQAARALSEIFLEVVAAPAFSVEAQTLFAQKKHLRLVQLTKLPKSLFEVRSALGGWLVQESDRVGVLPEFKTVTKTEVPAHCMPDLAFAWKVVQHVRSNAIVLARDLVTCGLGGGQTSRVESVALALKKCPAEKLNGTVLASDAFFPFRDNVDLLAGKGIAAIVQPGGSRRDNEVIEACDEHGIAMVFTGIRHFRH